MSLRSALAVMASSTALIACGSSNSVDLSDTSVTKLSGTLGALGDTQPTVSSLMIANSGETLVYLSSAKITCATLQESRWLGGVAAGSQVVELVIKGAPTVKTYPVPPSEVNFAPTGKSSAYETTADSGEIVFTKAVEKSLVEGTIHATYGGDEIVGTFHATYCDNGQGY